MIVMLAGIVGIIVISILVPMFNMYESISMWG
jgi:type II secretory pathway component PulF